MTEEDKAKRRTVIQEQSQAKQAAKEMTYWVTRDREPDGTLAPFAVVWLSRPGRPHGRWECSVETVATLNGEALARFAEWTIPQCLRTCRVYPETEFEAIRVGV